MKVHPGKGTARVDTIQNVSVTPGQAGQYAKNALHSQKDKGFVEGYRYHIYNSGDGMHILFLSRQASLEMHRSASVSLILVSDGGLVLMAVILSLLSGNRRKLPTFRRGCGDHRPVFRSG